jgi:putative spermidine/putrescine transport system substrate-binding protein
VHRYTFIAVLGIAVALVAATASGAPPKKWPKLTGSTITFVASAGTTQDARHQAWEIPFEKATGAKVRFDQRDYAKLRAQVQFGNVTWDIVEADTFFINQHCGTLFVPRDRRIVKSIKNTLPKTITNSCGIPVVSSATLMAYDSKKFSSNAPKTWADFFNTEKYPGKRSIWNFPLNGMLEAALLADGVSVKRLYPLDTRRAFNKLKTIKSDILFAASLSQQQEQLVSGQAAMAMTFNGRLLAAIQQGSSFRPVWRHNLRNWDNVAVVKGSKRSRAAMWYLEYLLQPAVQNRLTRFSPYTSALRGPQPKTDALTARFLATRPAHYKVGIDINHSWWARNYEDVAEKWTEFTSG